MDFGKAAVLLLALLLFAGCSSSTTSDLTQAGEDAVSSQINQELSEKTSTLQEESEVRNGTQEDTLATPPDFPESYNYGSGRYTDWGYSEHEPPPAGAGGERRPC